MKSAVTIFASALLVANAIARSDAADTIHLTDAPGNWFRSASTGTPLSVIDTGERVDFVINNCCTNTRHTVTLAVKPTGSQVTMDQDSSRNGSLSVTFDFPGVYVFICKIHPYMTAVVAVRDEVGGIPNVSAASLPFIGYLGATSLPAATVLSVMTTVAATDKDKAAKWRVFLPSEQILPPTPGVGEIWVDTQFERVPGQTDTGGVAKPGTITVVDASNWTIKREVNGLAAGGKWNNPHNMWANFALDTVYNANWFGKWINKINRATGQVIESITVGEAPTHIISVPTPNSSQIGVLTIPLSADNDMVKVRDEQSGLRIIDSVPTGTGRTHPHAHWLTCGTGDRTIVPNVFKGIGLGGSVSVLNTLSGAVMAEFTYDQNDPIRKALLMPIAVGECHVRGTHKAYIANLASGFVTVMNVDSLTLTKNIPVTLTPDGQSGKGLLDTLQVPIQTPVSPDEKWVATAVLSLTTVPRPSVGAADHIAIIDTRTDQVVKYVPMPPGAHGVNWGAKRGGGYYAYVTCQHANALIVLDPDPNNDGNATDAAVVGRIVLSNGTVGAGITDGMGGQGVKPLPMTHDGWVQPTVAMMGTGALSPEVEGWISLLTPEQKDPGHQDEIRIHPSQFTVAPGNIEAGQLSSLFDDDGERLAVRPGLVFNGADRPVQVTVEGIAPGSAPSALKLAVDSQTSSPSAVNQRLEAYNFATGQWVQIDQRTVGIADLTLEFALPNPAQFIDGDNRVRARVSFAQQSILFSYPWLGRLDRVGWHYIQ